VKAITNQKRSAEEKKAILNGMMIYLFGGKKRLQMIRDMLTELSKNGVQIFIITGSTSPINKFVELLTKTIPEYNIRYTNGMLTKAKFLGYDPRLYSVYKKTTALGSSIKSLFGYGGASRKRTQTQKRNRKYNRKQKTQKQRKSRK
jgi:hypothetical protein